MENQYQKQPPKKKKSSIREWMRDIKHTERSSVMLENSSLAFFEIQKLPTLVRAFSIFIFNFFDFSLKSQVFKFFFFFFLSCLRLSPQKTSGLTREEKKKKRRKFLFLFSSTQHKNLSISKPKSPSLQHMDLPCKLTTHVYSQRL